MIDQFAPISGEYSLLYFFTHKPLVEVHHAFHRVNYEFFAVTAPFGGKLSQLGLQLRVETDFHATRQELVASSEVRVLCEGIVEDLNGNLARFEKLLKKVLVVADEFSTEDGTLTASLKLRRHKVEERYRQEIEEMYQQSEAAGRGATTE